VVPDFQDLQDSQNFSKASITQAVHGDHSSWEHGEISIRDFNKLKKVADQGIDLLGHK